VITELYRRNIWTDARTVNLVADAVRHPAPRVMVGALKFFLGEALVPSDRLLMVYL